MFDVSQGQKTFKESSLDFLFFWNLIERNHRECQIETNVWEKHS